EELIREIGAQVRADRIDVTERAAFLAYADAVKEHFGSVNQIYNIAGIAFLGDIEVSQFKDIEKVMDVDYWGVSTEPRRSCRTSSRRVTAMSSTCQACSACSACRVRPLIPQPNSRCAVSPRRCAKRWR